MKPLSDNKNAVLIGAGGHARVVVELAEMLGYRFVGYSALSESPWMAAPKVSDDAVLSLLEKGLPFILGVGGQSVESLAKRHQLFLKYLEYSCSPVLVHSRATLSASATVGQGSLVFAGATIQSATTIGQAVLINTHAVVEHDCIIGDGSHIAPGALVLGGAKVGKNCMIGAGSVLLPSCVVPDESLVKANTTFK